MESHTSLIARLNDRIHECLKDLVSPEESVAILDFRFDKAVDLGRAGRVTPMVDFFNLLNSGVPTTVRITNTATAPFREVTAILNPRVIRFSIRYSF